MVGSKLLLAVSLLLLALASLGALAPDIKTQSPIRYLWHNDPFQDKTRGNLLRYVYVKLGATRIDASCQISTVGGGRVCLR